VHQGYRRGDPGKRRLTLVSHMWQGDLILSRSTVPLPTFLLRSRRGFLLTYLRLFDTVRNLHLSALSPLSDKGGGGFPEFHSLLFTTGLPSCDGQLTCLPSSGTSGGEGNHETLAL
jgi:hypothetical protein